MIIAGNNPPTATAREATLTATRGAKGVLGETGSETQVTDTDRGSAIARDH